MVFVTLALEKLGRAMKSTTSRKPADRPLPSGSPRFLHCFLEWFKKNQGRFAISVSVKKIRENSIVLVFPSTTGCINAHVHSSGGWDEIVVWARWKSQWDIIHESEAEALATDNAYVCALCEVRISAIVDACFSVIVDGVSAPSWTRRDARKRGFNVSQTPRSTVVKYGREALGFDFGLWCLGFLSIGPCQAAGGPPVQFTISHSQRFERLAGQCI